MDTFLPVDDATFVPDDLDFEFAERFRVLADAVEGCQRPEEAALLVSTCRNAFLTVNAIFEDVSLVLGHSSRGAPLLRSIFLLREGKWAQVDKLLTERVDGPLADARKKVKAWAERHSILSELESSLLGDRLIDEQRLQRILYHDATPFRTPSGDAWNPRYYRLDPSEEPSIQPLFKLLELALVDLQIVSSFCRSLGQLCGQIEDRTRQQSLLTESNTTIDKREAAWHKFVEHLQAAAPVFEISVVSDDDGLEIIGPESRLRIQENADEQSIQTLFVPLLTLVERAIEARYASVRDRFMPNLGTPPLPPPFRIDLRPHALPQRTSWRDFRVGGIDCDSGEAPEEVTLAGLVWTVPSRWYDQEMLIFREGDHTSELKRVAMRALVAAKEQGADALVLPEYFVPQEHVEELHDASMKYNIALIAGLEARNTPRGKLINEAIVSIPGMPPFRQRKQAPSIYEPTAQAFVGDNLLHVFENTGFGTFAVVLCSDFFEMDLLAHLAREAPRLDLLIVPAHSPHPNLFVASAQAVSFAMYTSVLVVNTSDREHTATKPPAVSATVLASPNEALLIEPRFIELSALAEPTPSLALWKLRPKDVAAKRLGKPTKGLLNPPTLRRSLPTLE